MGREGGGGREGKGGEGRGREGREGVEIVGWGEGGGAERAEGAHWSRHQNRRGKAEHCVQNKLINAGEMIGHIDFIGSSFS